MTRMGTMRPPNRDFSDPRANPDVCRPAFNSGVEVLSVVVVVRASLSLVEPKVKRGRGRVTKLEVVVVVVVVGGGGGGEKSQPKVWPSSRRFNL